MVEKINDKTKVLQLQTQSSQSLRDSFKNISSRLDVASEVRDTIKTQNPQPEGRSQRAASLLRGLNDAVSFSSLALKSLEDASKGETIEPPEVDAVQQFSEDVQQLRSDVMKILDALREKAETADVLGENLSSAGSTIEDVNAAYSHAQETGSHISFNRSEAVNAHNNLSADRVVELLNE